MTVDKDFEPRTFRIDKLIRSVAITATLTAACLLPIVAQAQTTEPAVGSSTTTITTTTTITPAPVVIPTLSDITAGAPPNIDYTILGNPSFNYAQIRRAQAYGMNDRQIGRVIGIADKAGVPPSDILNRVRDGWTFQMIADYYGTPASYMNPSYGQKVDDYLTAYQATGRGAIKMASNYGSSTSSSGTLYGGVPASMQSTDIIQTLRSSGDFDMLVRALHRARLDSTLNGAGPYTMFAPTDEAFAKLAPDQLKALMRDRTELRQVLQYHVIPGRISAADAMSMSSPTSPQTLEGDTLNVTTSNGQVKVNNATVTTPDIQASNGVIHAIDTVLVPSSVNLMATPMTPAYPAP
jgi:uncharacterized surface protein with fasciclin (FAS1) repeats